VERSDAYTAIRVKAAATSANGACRKAEKQSEKNTCTHENSDSKQHYYSSAHFFQPVGPNCPSNIEQLILH
jgi:hypothetical protein